MLFYYSEFLCTHTYTHCHAHTHDTHTRTHTESEPHAHSLLIVNRGAKLLTANLNFSGAICAFILFAKITFPFTNTYMRYICHLFLLVQVFLLGFYQLSALRFSHQLLVLRQFQNNIPQVRRRRESVRESKRRRWRQRRQRVGMNGSQYTEHPMGTVQVPMPIANCRQKQLLSASLSLSWSVRSLGQLVGMCYRFVSCTRPFPTPSLLFRIVVRADTRDGASC